MACAVFTYDPEGSDVVLDAGYLTAPLVSWVGGGSGDWNTASNWSGNSVPTSSDIVYIPAGSTVTVSSGSANADQLLVAGTLNLGGGDLFLQGQAIINALNLSNGNIYGGELTVTSSFDWSGGNVNGGSGDFVIAPGATQRSTVPRPLCGLSWGGR